MLMPKRVKWRKQHRGRRGGKASGGNVVSFGEYGLQAVESCWMTANQIESARIAMNRYVKRTGKIWIRVFPDKPFTKKPAETRMGSGKGAPEGWVAVIKPGRVLFEMAGVEEDQAREAMRLAAHKLPIATKFIKREVTGTGAAEEEETEEAEVTTPLMTAPVGSAGDLAGSVETGEEEEIVAEADAAKSIDPAVLAAKETSSQESVPDDMVNTTEETDAEP